MLKIDYFLLLLTCYYNINGSYKLKHLYKFNDYLQYNKILRHKGVNSGLFMLCIIFLFIYYMDQLMFYIVS